MIQKFETNVGKIKTISINLNADVGVSDLESLLSLAKTNYANGDSDKAEQTLEKLAVKGIQAYEILNEINKQNQIIRAKMFVEKYMPQINNLISIAKNQQLKQTVEKLEQSKLQLSLFAKNLYSYERYILFFTLIKELFSYFFLLSFEAPFINWSILEYKFSLSVEWFFSK